MQDEDRLQTLIQGNSEDNRTKWAKEWQQKGKKVIGIMTAYVPEEVILAAGMLPWRITGTWQENVDRARVYRSEKTCPYCTAVLESFLSGELDFLDGIVTSYQDQDFLRLWDVLVYLKIQELCLFLNVPFSERQVNLNFFATEIRSLISSLENFSGVKVTENSLHSAIDTCNKTRQLLKRLYQLRKREKPPLSGAEVLGIVTTAQVMPKEQFNQELEELLPYLEKRRTSLKQVHPRLLISSDKLDNPAYISLVEEQGCLVAMDDMDTGIRYFKQEVDTTHTDLAYALAQRYLKNGEPRMANWAGQIEQIIKLVKGYKIDGVLSLPHAYEYSQLFRLPVLSEKLDEAGILHTSLEREYHLANVGQLRTRIGAFLEMISAK